MNNKTKKEKTVPAFQTFALVDTKSIDPATNVSIPSEDNVKEAKDWVDYNQK